MPKRRRPRRKKVKGPIRSRTSKRRRHSKQPGTKRGKADKVLPEIIRAACSRRNERPGPAEKLIIFTMETRRTASKRKMSPNLTSEIGDDARSFNPEFPLCLRDSVVDLLLTSSFPRLLIEVFYSQMRSYTSFHSMLKTANRRWLCVFLFFCVAISSALAQDAPALPAAAVEFVQLILSRAGSPSAVAVTFQNLSSLPPERQEAL